MARVRRKKRRIGIGILILLLVIGWVGISFSKGFVRNLRMRAEIASLDKEVDALNLRNAQLLTELEQIHSPEYVEQVAREELGLVKPGEQLYILSSPLDADANIDVVKRQRSSTARD